MAAGTKAPPVLMEDGNYAAWKHKLQAWELLTELKEEKRGLAVYLQGLKGNYQTVISKVPIEDLNKKDGVKRIISILDRYCESKISIRQYDVYERIHSFTRGRDESVNDALIKYEAMMMDMVALDMNLPQPVLAFHVLKSMNVGVENEKLVRATVTELTYDKMVAQIRSVMETLNIKDSKKKNEDTEGLGEVKLEPEESATLFTRDQNWTRRSRGGRRGRGGRSRLGNRFSSDRYCYSCGDPTHLSYECPNRSRSGYGNGTEGASASAGTERRCFKCQSPDHFAYACPSKNSESGGRSHPVKITLLEL